MSPHQSFGPCTRSYGQIPHQSEKQDPDQHQSEKVAAYRGSVGALEGPNMEKVTVDENVRKLASCRV
jgi:hypothetical protein